MAILAGGDSLLANLIAAASLLSRMFTWLLPMLVGLIPLAMWQRSQAKLKREEAVATSS